MKCNHQWRTLREYVFEGLSTKIVYIACCDCCGKIKKFTIRG